jgi:hypothetical protein
MAGDDGMSGLLWMPAGTVEASPQPSLASSRKSPQSCQLNLSLDQRRLSRAVMYRCLSVLISWAFCIGAVVAPALASAAAPTLDEIRQQYLESIKIFGKFEATASETWLNYPPGSLTVHRGEIDIAKDGAQEIISFEAFSADGTLQGKRWCRFNGTRTHAWNWGSSAYAGRPVLPQGSDFKGYDDQLFARVHPLRYVGLLKPESLPEWWEAKSGELIGTDGGTGYVQVRFGPTQRVSNGREIIQSMDCWFDPAHGMLPARMIMHMSFQGDALSTGETRITAFRGVEHSGKTWYVPERAENFVNDIQVSAYELKAFGVVSQIPPGRLQPQYPEGVIVRVQQPDGSFDETYPGPGGKDVALKLKQEAEDFYKSRYADGGPLPLKPIPETEPLPAAPLKNTPDVRSAAPPADLTWLRAAQWAGAVCLAAGVILRLRSKHSS